MAHCGKIVRRLLDLLIDQIAAVSQPHARLHRPLCSGQLVARVCRKAPTGVPVRKLRNGRGGRGRWGEKKTPPDEGQTAFTVELKCAPKDDFSSTAIEADDPLLGVELNVHARGIVFLGDDDARRQDAVRRREIFLAHILTGARRVRAF